MKNLFVLLFAVMMFFGIAGCPSSDNPSTVGGHSGFTSQSVSASDTISAFTGNDVSPVPEPASLILLGTGLVGLAGLGRKRFKR